MTDIRQQIDIIEQSNSKPSESTNLERFETTHKVNNNNNSFISRPVSKLAAKVKADAKRLAKDLCKKKRELKRLNSTQPQYDQQIVDDFEDYEPEEPEEEKDEENEYDEYCEEYSNSSQVSMSDSFVEQRLSALGMLPWVKDYYSD